VIRGFGEDTKSHTGEAGNQSATPSARREKILSHIHISPTQRKSGIAHLLPARSVKRVTTDANSACLGPFVSIFLHKCHFGINIQILKASVEN